MTVPMVVQMMINCYHPRPGENRALTIRMAGWVDTETSAIYVDLPFENSKEALEYAKERGWSAHVMSDWR